MHVSPSFMEQSSEKRTRTHTHTHIIYKDKANEHSKINANYVPAKHTRTRTHTNTCRAVNLLGSVCKAGWELRGSFSASYRQQFHTALALITCSQKRP